MSFAELKNKELNMKKTIAQIVAETLVEFGADLGKNILAATTPARPQRDATTAAVFREYAALNDQSITSAGNDCQWNLTGLQAAIVIANHRVWLAHFSDEENSFHLATNAVVAVNILEILTAR